MGRAVVADALRSSDPTGARAAEQATHWRSDYLVHFRRLVEAGLASPAGSGHGGRGRPAVTARTDAGARPGCGSMGSASGRTPGAGSRVMEIKGTGDPVGELVLPYRGDRLRGNEIRRRVNTWVDAGVVEPTIADVVEEVLANPDWLRLEGHTVAVLGAGAEMGPLPSLMRWGARVAAVDLDRAPIWERVLGLARDGAGTLVVPVAADADTSSLEEVAGVDLLAEVPSVQRWLEEQPGTARHRQLRLRGRCHERTGLGGGRRADHAAAGESRRRGARVPGDADRRVRRTGGGGGALDPRVRRPLGRRQDHRPAAASALGWQAAAPQLRGGLRPRASTTRWCRSRDRTTRWPSGCSAGVRPSPVSRARPSR